MEEPRRQELQDLAMKVDKILKEEIEKAGLTPLIAEVRLYDLKTVGVQGDKMTYSYPAEIDLRQKSFFEWDPSFLSDLSVRITNEIKKINRVVYVIR